MVILLSQDWAFAIEILDIKFGEQIINLLALSIIVELTHLKDTTLLYFVQVITGYSAYHIKSMMNGTVPSF